MIREFDAAYPAKNDAEVASAYLGLLRDVTFTLDANVGPMTATGGEKSWLISSARATLTDSKYLGAHHPERSPMFSGT
jgi:hypothetical protein